MLLERSRNTWDSILMDMSVNAATAQAGCTATHRHAPFDFLFLLVNSCTHLYRSRGSITCFVITYICINCRIEEFLDLDTVHSVQVFMSVIFTERSSSEPGVSGT